MIRVVHGVMIVSIFWYALASEYLFPHQENGLDRTIAIGFVVTCVLTIGIALIVRARMITPALAALQKAPDDAAALGRWRSGAVASDVFANAVALYGSGLRGIGGTLADSAPFYIAGLVLMVLWWPKPPER